MPRTTDLRVGNLMSTDPVVVGPDASAAEAERLLKTNRVSGLPVVDDGATVGVISLTDLVVASQPSPHTAARQVGRSAAGEWARRRAPDLSWWTRSSLFPAATGRRPRSDSSVSRA